MSLSLDDIRAAVGKTTFIIAEANAHIRLGSRDTDALDLRNMQEGRRLEDVLLRTFPGHRVTWFAGDGVEVLIRKERDSE